MIGIYDLLKGQGKYRPDKCALVCEGKRYTYRELNQRINCVAYGLHELGVKKGSHVGLLLTNGVDFISLFYAVIKLGGCITPLNYRYTIDELEQLRSVVDCEYIISSKFFLDNVDQLVLEEHDHDVITVFTDVEREHPSIHSFLENGQKDWDYTEPLDEDDVNFNVFTGGTPATPKAAAHTQYSSLMRVMAFMMDPVSCNPDIVYMNYAPMFHIGGIGGMLRILSCGATFCLLENFNMDKIVEMIVNERATDIALIPPTILNLFEELTREQGLDLSSMRLLTLAGGVCDEPTLDLAFHLMPDVMCSITLGSSENPVVLSNVFRKEDFEANRQIYRSVGKPQFLYDVKLIKEDGTEAGVNEPGEMYGRSPAMMSGYCNHANPFTEDGWFPTGDILRRDEDGNYFFCTRSKDMIKCGGENIYAVEVENAIVTNPKVKQCAVVGIPDKQWGEIVAAAVVLQPGEEISKQEIIDYCKSKIASYKKPKAVCFVNQLPVTDVGKVNKVAVKQLLLDHLSIESERTSNL